jgi:hypothetical protein
VSDEEPVQAAYVAPVIEPMPPMPTEGPPPTGRLRGAAHVVVADPLPPVSPMPPVPPPSVFAPIEPTDPPAA